MTVKSEVGIGTTFTIAITMLCKVKPQTVQNQKILKIESRKTVSPTHLSMLNIPSFSKPTSQDKIFRHNEQAHSFTVQN